MKLRILAASVICLAGCATYQGSSGDPNSTSFYTVGGHRVHLITEGNGPTIILSGGGGVNDPYRGFAPLISRLAPQAKVVLYERPGYGLSEPSSTPRDVNVVVEELDELFSQAKLAKPFVLVGHSMASLELLRYAQVYPEKVKALLFLEGAPPKYYLTMKMPSDFEQGLYTLFFGLAKGNALEVKSLVGNAQKVIDSGELREIPLFYFYAGSNGIPGWAEAQREFSRYSSRAEGILIPEANHFIYENHASLIASKILEATQ